MSAEAQSLAGMQVCLFGSAAHYCGEPATVHVLREGDFPTMSCKRHAGRWAIESHLDLHKIGGACGFPDTRWLWSWSSPPGLCVVDGLEGLTFEIGRSVDDSELRISDMR